MGMNVGGSRGGLKSEINVTPLVDVVLVLLIIFMVVTPMMQRGQAVKLPQAANVTESEGRGPKVDPLVLSLTPDRKMFIESEQYADAAALQARLEQELREQPRRRLLLKADEALAYGDVQRVMELARAAGAKGVFLGVEELKSSEQGRSSDAHP
jgi:biopolymer transport protein ExbD